MLSRPNHAIATIVASFLLMGVAVAQSRPELVVGVNSLGSKLDPAESPLAPELRIHGSVFDTLIKRDYQAEAADPQKGAVLVPSLATVWQRQDDRTIELKLRQGVLFHNGDELTAEDVAFTLSPERIFGPNALLPSAKKFFGCLEPVEVVDRATVRIKACAPDPTLEHKLAHYAAAIVNKRAYLTLGQAKFKRAPIGTGPLKFVEWRDGDLIRFSAHDAFFGGRPAFQGVTFREVPETAARVAGIVSGEFNLITQIGPDQFPVINAHPELEVRPSLLEQTQILWLVATEPAIADKRVRQALALATDRAKLVSTIWEGKTVVDNQFQIPTLGLLFNPERKGLGYDPARARALLSEAGYKGAPVVIRVLANYYINGESIAQAVQAMWQDVGVNAKLEIVENFTQAYAPGRAAVMGGCGFEFAAPESLASCFFGDQALTRQRGFPKGVPGLDRLAERLATLDISERKRIFQEILDVFDDEVPAILIYRTPQFFAASKNVRWQATPDFRTDFRPGNLSFAGSSN